MTKIVRRFAKQEADGSFTIDHASAKKLADELWTSHPGLWPGRSAVEKMEYFESAWKSNDPNGAGKILAD